MLCSRPVAAQPPAVDEVLPKVVKIFGAGGLRGLPAYSTGFLFSPDGHIATSWNHVLDAGVVNVVLDDGRRFVGEVLGAEPQLELAVIKIDAADLPHFDLSESADTSDPGEIVYAFSNMYRIATGDEPVSVMRGVISAVTTLDARRGRYDVPLDFPVYLIDQIVNNPGAAGGAVVSWDGRLLGMIGRQVTDAQTNTLINYAIPVSEVADELEAIRTGDFSATEPTEDPMPDDSGIGPLELGIVLVPDVVARTPAYVEQVIAGSQAAEQNLQPDDLIVFVNGRIVRSIRDLHDHLSRLEPLDDVSLVVRRENQLITVSLVVPQ